LIIFLLFPYFDNTKLRRYKGLLLARKGVALLQKDDLLK